MSRLRWPDSTNSVSEKPGTIQFDRKKLSSSTASSKLSIWSADLPNTRIGPLPITQLSTSRLGLALLWTPKILGRARVAA